MAQTAAQAPATRFPQAELIFKDAFEKLQLKVSPDDARNFHSTTLKDVCKAARDIEQQLGARQSLRNMRRLQPFFDWLERYSRVVEVLCNGTPYLSWIWVRRIGVHWNRKTN